MRLIDKLEENQKGSQLFDDCRLIFQHYLQKSKQKESSLLKEKLFDDKCLSFKDLFQISSIQLDQNHFIQFSLKQIQLNILKKLFNSILDN